MRNYHFNLNLIDMDVLDFFKKYSLNTEKDYIVRPNGDMIEIKPDKDGFYSLEKMQALIGGYIEIYSVSSKYTYVGDEEGVYGGKENIKLTDLLKGKVNLYNDLAWGNGLIVKNEHLR